MEIAYNRFHHYRPTCLDAKRKGFHGSEAAGSSPAWAQLPASRVSPEQRCRGDKRRDGPPGL